MTPNDLFKQQARRAREEQIAPVDVADAVLRRVQAEAPVFERVQLERRLVLAASLSLVAAAAVLGLALPWMDEIYDPFVQLLQSSAVGNP